MLGNVDNVKRKYLSSNSIWFPCEINWQMSFQFGNWWKVLITFGCFVVTLALNLILFINPIEMMLACHVVLLDEWVHWKALTSYGEYPVGFFVIFA